MPCNPGQRLWSLGGLGHSLTVQLVYNPLAFRNLRCLRVEQGVHGNDLWSGERFDSFDHMNGRFAIWRLAG